MSVTSSLLMELLSSVSLGLPPAGSARCRGRGAESPSGGGGVFRPASSVLRPPCGSVFASRGLVPVGRYARGEGCYVFLAHGPLVITSHCIPDNLDIAPLEVRAATPAFS